VIHHRLGHSKTAFLILDRTKPFCDDLGCSTFSGHHKTRAKFYLKHGCLCIETNRLPLATRSLSQALDACLISLNFQTEDLHSHLTRDKTKCKIRKTRHYRFLSIIMILLSYLAEASSDIQRSLEASRIAFYIAETNLSPSDECYRLTKKYNIDLQRKYSRLAQELLDFQRV
jgi:hypothetical protein